MNTGMIAFIIPVVIVMFVLVLGVWRIVQDNNKRIQEIQEKLGK